MEQETPKKISAEQIEVIDAHGHVIQESKEQAEMKNPFGGAFGGVKVFRGGPAVLLLLPLLIPIAIIGMFLVTIFALIFGRSVFKVIRFK
jgi:hypothetical protein